MILPLIVNGSSATNSTMRGYSCAAKRSFTNSWISRASSGDATAPAPSTMTALTSCVRTGSGTPTTAAIATAGCLRRHSSISTGPMRYPALVIRSSDRPSNPEVAVLVLAAVVSSQQEVARVLRGRRGVVAPVSQKHDGIGPADPEHAGRARSDRVPGLVDDADVVAGNGPSHRARLYREQLGVVADDHVAFGLSVEFVDRHAERPPAPFEQIVAEGFAAASHRADPMGAERPRVGLPHQLKRRRRQEHVSNAPARHEPIRLFGIELARSVRHDRYAVVQRR